MKFVYAVFLLENNLNPVLRPVLRQCSEIFQKGKPFQSE